MPQRRRRVIFIAYREGEKKPEYPKPILNKDEYITLKEAIGDLEKDSSTHEQEMSEFQKESRIGRTPTMKGNVLTVSNLMNTEVSNITPVVKEKRKKKEVDAKHLLFLWSERTAKQYCS